MTEGINPRIAIVDLTSELKVRKQTLFKIVKRLGIKTEQQREQSRGNQLIATLSRDEASRVGAELGRNSKRLANESGDWGTNCSGDSDDIVGSFYVLQLEPSHDRGRFKTGFTTDLQDRLRKHRCSAPFAQYLKTWPCRRRWERTAEDCVTKNCEWLREEVYRAVSMDNVLVHGEQFFDLMPKLVIGSASKLTKEETVIP